ncbi:DUF2970 domain-containing protein [Alteromonas halophila]|uniref:DUF2970 domain-containing protein n=1 Tax=Alteromonas halophila TaxID=516698 RepID=A0A918JJF3_9ALTE|nr:DUF2970 domain-containing protein [Alteromonas halophila]GGW78815.1 hypothetical protein GCM10007391_09310 [Alteromonas halophila]
MAPRRISNQHDSSPGILDVIRSVLASAFGVQSQKNYKRDFTQVSAVRYVVVGVVFVILFVIGLMLLVSAIIPG